MIQVNGLKEHKENRDSTRNENNYSNLPLRKSENGKLKLSLILLYVLKYFKLEMDNSEET